MRTYSAAAALAATFSLATAANDIPTCDPENPCPAETPCCSQYGQCGVGAYCLGGCDPKGSFDLQSCVAGPMCKSEDYKLNSMDGITRNTDYLGDYSTTNWVSSGQPVVWNDEAILLTMAPSTVGTLLMSTHYVWYGKISATMTTSQGAGVVTAFILMSDVKDEIDFEFVGVDLEAAQSNYYWQGVTDYNNGENITTSNTVQNEHTYTIDWQPDSITWSIDGQVGRVLNKNSTYNDTDNTYHFPQTPSRVQLSLWPAGLSSNAKGTIEWAGGLVDWDSPYMQNGYYYAMVKDVSVECYNPPAGYQDNGNKAYYYTSKAGLESDVATGNNNTELASFFATGDDMSKDPNKKTDGSKTTKSAAAATPQTVPGLSGGGVQGLAGAQTGNNDGSSSNGNSQQGGNSGSSNDGSFGGAIGSTSFQQGSGANGNGNGGTSQASQVVAGSAVALIGFFVAALMI